MWARGCFQLFILFYLQPWHGHPPATSLLNIFSTTCLTKFFTLWSYSFGNAACVCCWLSASAGTIVSLQIMRTMVVRVIIGDYYLSSHFTFYPQDKQPPPPDPPSPLWKILPTTRFTRAFTLPVLSLKIMNVLVVVLKVLEKMQALLLSLYQKRLLLYYRNFYCESLLCEIILEYVLKDIVK